VVFSSLYFGVRAMMIIITNDVKAGKDTIRKLITEYAPPNENDTAAYIAYISQMTSILPDQSLRNWDSGIINVVYSMIVMESGEPAQMSLISQVYDDVYDGSTPDAPTLTASLGMGLMAVGLLLLFTPKN